MFKEYILPNIDSFKEKSSLKTKEGEDAIVCSHLKLVLSISNSYKNIKTNRISYDDIVQEGILGLYDALNRFDPSVGVRFSSFARPYILNSIKRYLRDNSHLLFIPPKTLWQTYKLKRFVSKNPEATKDDMCRHLNETPCHIDILSTLIGSKEYSLIDFHFISNKENFIPEQSEKSKKLNELIVSLSDKDKALLSMRDIQEMSWREIGKELCLSHEAVRKRYAKIVLKLRENAEYLSKGI